MRTVPQYSGSNLRLGPLQSAIFCYAFFRCRDIAPRLRFAKRDVPLSLPTDQQKAAAAALLEWYVAMGVDCAISETPTDWSQKSAKPTAATTASRTTVRQAPAPPVMQPAAGSGRFSTATPPDEAETLAREQAASAKSLDELEAILRNFDGCALKATAKNLCFYRGSPRAQIAIIGEAPGRDEDIAGKPFVGRAGQLLDKMLASIDLSESDVHITNIVYWRPPGNRTPTPLEAQICRPFLMRQMELLDPKMVLVLGGAAAKNILNVTDGIMRLRGKWRVWTIGEREVPLMASLHPAYLLRTPAAKRLAWRDLLAVHEARKSW